MGVCFVLFSVLGLIWLIALSSKLLSLSEEYETLSSRHRWLSRDVDELRSDVHVLEGAQGEMKERLFHMYHQTDSRLSAATQAMGLRYVGEQIEAKPAHYEKASRINRAYKKK